MTHDETPLATRLHTVIQRLEALRDANLNNLDIASTYDTAACDIRAAINQDGLFDPQVIAYKTARPEERAAIIGDLDLLNMADLTPHLEEHARIAARFAHGYQEDTA